MAWVLGLTGGIATGKSTASAFYASQGLPVIDADRIAHELTGPNAVGSLAVAQHFGKDFLTANGAMDRAKMRECVFHDPHAKARLETILHPLIQQQARAQLDQAKLNHEVVVFDCALLLSQPLWRSLADRILIIEASEALRIARLKIRNGFPREMALAIIRSQQPIREQFSMSHAIIVNEGSLSEFEERLTVLNNLWKI